MVAGQFYMTSNVNFDTSISFLFQCRLIDILWTSCQGEFISPDSRISTDNRKYFRISAFDFFI